MLNPGDYSLCDQPITTAINNVALTPIQDLEGMVAATIEAKLSWGSGGSSLKAYVQTTLDRGDSWIDIACFAFTTGSSIKVINLSGLTPITDAVTTSDGAMADNTCLNGILGSALRVRLVSVGTYATTIFGVKVNAR
ncbi:hypothetical protein [Ciceribacter sp. RN22]|uniref:hypothetical protein n=1 Tax=Ciceribacter sp. RN22 TaxID=2954932 RepID=UPI002093A01F|nr:hypothetical protein [Ciceribacter sp. RN22]MCO6178819.1 hypothetical protein [Ciceribacter sp. RN22]